VLSCCVLSCPALLCLLVATHSYPQQDPEQEEVLFNLEGSLLLPHTGREGAEPNAHDEQ
jgi:hypothetical protein